MAFVDFYLRGLGTPWNHQNGSFSHAAAEALICVVASIGQRYNDCQNI